MIRRGHHDMGGRPAGRVERSEHEYGEWDRRVDAMVQLASRRLGVTVDERRKNIEALPPQAYDSMSYYEKWLAAFAHTLLQRGVITTDELGRKMEEVSARHA
jgi:Nitrile hydratase beta subunit